jgi:hypothetical protein
MNLHRKILAAGSLAVMLAFPATAQDWTMASASATNYWISLASTADGGRLFAGTAFGDLAHGIFTSTNLGSTWTVTGAPAGEWDSVACSADGSVVLASGYRGYSYSSGVYVSTNFGTDWTLVLSQLWGSVACSADGKTMAAAVGGQTGIGGVYISTNYGAEWFPRIGATNGPGQLAMSADGSRLAVASVRSVDVSTNFGLTWTATSLSGQAMGNIYSTFLATSGAGTTLMAISLEWSSPGSNFISTSSDWGVTWRPVRSLTNYLDSRGFCAACSADGTTLAAVETSSQSYVNHLLLSTNSGISWSVTDLPWDTNICSIACSADGSRLAAAFLADQGYFPTQPVNGVIYARAVTPVPRLRVLSGPATLQLSWLVPSKALVLQESGDLLGWSPVAATPALNYTNLRYEVNLPAQTAPRFFRLASH